jgi:hypothetical protein
LNITDSGYLHEQDNQKIIRYGDADQLLVEEKGHNRYKRIADKECAVAKEYWEKNKNYWSKVRKFWADYTSTHNIIELKNKIDGKLLHEYLLALAKEYTEKKLSDVEIDSRIKAEISRFIGPEDKAVAVQ